MEPLIISELLGQVCRASLNFPLNAFFVPDYIRFMPKIPNETLNVAGRVNHLQVALSMHVLSYACIICSDGNNGAINKQRY